MSAEENGESKRTSRKRPLPAELPSPPEERETLKTKPQNKRNRKQNLSQEHDQLYYLEIENPQVSAVFSLVLT